MVLRHDHNKPYVRKAHMKGAIERFFRKIFRKYTVRATNLVTLVIMRRQSWAYTSG